jgi:hypothetical protein
MYVGTEQNANVAIRRKLPKVVEQRLLPTIPCRDFHLADGKTGAVVRGRACEINGIDFA